MLDSSVNALYDGSDNGTNQSDTVDGSISHSDAIGRFLADQEQPRLLGCSSPVQSAVEAEAASKARILAKLESFEQRFNSGNEPRATWR